MALKYVGRGVVSLNCAGSEGPPIAPYADIFRRAVEGGLHSTPHAGEWSGPENVWGDARAPPPRAHRPRRALGRRSSTRRPPGGAPHPVGGLSDVQRRHRRHTRRSRIIPFPRLRDAGVVVTLNSDDPAMFGSWVSDEYRVARDAFGYDDAALADIAATGVRASFADDERQAADAAGHRGVARGRIVRPRDRYGFGDRHRVDVDGLFRRLTGDVSLRGGGRVLDRELLDLLRDLEAVGDVSEDRVVRVGVELVTVLAGDEEELAAAGVGCPRSPWRTPPARTARRLAARRGSSTRGHRFRCRWGRRPAGRRSTYRCG